MAAEQTIDCLFCKIVKKQIPAKIIDENEHAIAFLDINPASNGHTLVIPKKHYRNVGLTDITYLNGMMRLVKNVTTYLEETFIDITGFNYLSNTNAQAGQIIFHTHIHIIPKYNKDVGFVFKANKDETNMLPIDTVYEKLKKK
ncbi:HIT family protein [Ureaplasma canigenitalium]|uniref:HIT family protein n=1 Tax=Ureaplasma canigenitalium TaxID=42092 RepID=UPI000AA6B6EC|nr:HIT domain-containing protein [Ureaplasma canigenitalium]